VGKKRRFRGLTIPLAPIAGLAAGLATPLDYAMKGDWDSALAAISMRYTGYNPATKVWNPEDLKMGLVPLIIGVLVHKFVGGPPLNLNRTLARAGVPFIRI